MSVWMLAVAALAAPAATVPDAVTASFVGTWTCKGRFVASGKPLAATIVIQPGTVAGTLAVDHRDVLPGDYHATELWSLSPKSVRAAIADASGMRWFEGVAEAERIVFTRSSGGGVVEQFAYALVGGVLTIDWSHRGANGALVPGDTLACRRDGNGS